MAIPPQFQKHAKKHHGKAPAKDSKDPKGAPFDAIPSGPLKGANPFQLNGASKSAPAKGASKKAKDRKHFLQNLAQKGK